MGMGISMAATWWQQNATRMYVPIVVFAAFSGWFIGTHSDAGAIPEAIAIISLFIVFPLFIITDSVLWADLAWCPLRAASLPLLEGALMYWSLRESDVRSLWIVATFSCAAVSFVISGATLVIRNGTKSTYVVPIEAPTELTDDTPGTGPHRAGIDGWLLLPATGLVLGSVVVPVGLAMELARLDSGYAGYSVPRVLVNAGLCIYLWVAVFRFFGKRQTAPQTMVIYMVASTIASMALFILGLAVIGTSDTAVIMSLKANNFLARGLAAAIWVPYFMSSRRVKATFVN